MNRLSSVIALGLLSSSLALAQGRPKAEITPLADADGVHAGSTVRVALQVALPEGVHVQSDQPRDPMLIPTVLAIDAPTGVTVAEIVYPEATDFAQAGQPAPLAVFERRFVIGARLTLGATLGAGDLIVPARFRYQACDATTCFAPLRAAVQWTLKVVPSATPVSTRLPEVFDRLRFRR